MIVAHMQKDRQDELESGLFVSVKVRVLPHQNDKDCLHYIKNPYKVNDAMTES